MPRGTHQRPAFTLFELLVVTVVLTTIALIAVPRFSQANARFGLRAAAEQVRRDVRLAQDLARANSSAYELRIEFADDRISVHGPVSGAMLNPHRVTDYAAPPFGVDLTTSGGDRALQRVGINGFGDLSETIPFRLIGADGTGMDAVLLAPAGSYQATGVKAR